MERHFSDKVIRLLDYDDLIKIQKRNLTIVFWDIENSSGLSDMLMSADIAYTELVQAWYSTVSEIIFEFDGSVDKFIGDGTMAIFGIPNKDPEGKQDAINSVTAALKAREGFEAVKKEWNERWVKDFSRNLISRTTETRVRGRFEIVERGTHNLSKILGSFPVYEVIK